MASAVSPATVLAAGSEFNQQGVVEDGLEGRSYEWCYWRKPDGYIVFAPMWPTEMVNQLRTGWTLLDRYGSFNQALNAHEDGGAWRPNMEPYRRILMRGGAEEFSIEQIRAHGWHRKPPYRWVKFPHLQINPETGNIIDPESGEELVDQWCDLCPQATRRPFLTASNLQQHQVIAHKDTSADQRNARNLAEANRPTAELLAEVLKRQDVGEGQMASAVAQLTQLLEAVFANQKTAGKKSAE